MKVRGSEGKRILKEAVADVVPAAIRARKKQGFGAPVGPWLRGPCAHLLDDLPALLDDLIDPAQMRRVLDEHAAGSADHRRRIWSALVLARWRRHHT
jgi:asparagine synthase (glutamine-hydrolysing)